MWDIQCSNFFVICYVEYVIVISDHAWRTIGTHNIEKAIEEYLNSQENQNFDIYIINYISVFEGNN